MSRYNRLPALLLACSAGVLAVAVAAEPQSAAVEVETREGGKRRVTDAKTIQAVSAWLDKVKAGQPPRAFVPPCKCDNAAAVFFYDRAEDKAPARRELLFIDAPDHNPNGLYITQEQLKELDQLAPKDAAKGEPKAAAPKRAPRPGRGLICGKLVDEAGKPVSGVKATAFDVGALRKPSPELAAAVSDKDGNFVLDVAPAKRVAITALHQPKAPVSPAPGEMYGQSEEFPVKAGEVKEIVVKMCAANM